MRLSFFQKRDQTNGSCHPFQRRIMQSPRSGSVQQGVLEIDTNLVENMIRPTKLGMKNWMFFGSLEAGSNNALIYTLLANCRAHDLDPEDYLVEVIKRLPPNSTPEQAAALTPARIAAERRTAAESAA